MSLSDDINARCRLILDECPKEVQIPDRASSAAPRSITRDELSHLSEVVTLVMLDLIARQVRHLGLVGTVTSKRAVIIRLDALLDIVKRLEGYQLIKRSEALCGAVSRVSGLVESFKSEHGSLY